MAPPSNCITIHAPYAALPTKTQSSNFLLVSVQYSPNMRSKLTILNTSDDRKLIFKLKINEERYSADAISGIIAPYRQHSIEIKLTDNSSQMMFQELFFNGQSSLDSLSKGDEISVETCAVPPCVSKMIMPFITDKDKLINWCVWNYTMAFNNNPFINNVQLIVQRIKVNVHLIASLPTADIPSHWRDAIEEHILNIANQNTTVSVYDKIKSLEEELESKQKLVSSTKKKLNNALAGYDVIRRPQPYKS